MNESTSRADGWLNSLRRTGDSLLGLAQSRIELFAVELQEEKLRALRVTIWLVIALALVVAGMLVGLSALAICLWNVAGYWGLVGLAVASLGTGAGALWRTPHGMGNGPTPFAETIGEFKKDRACLRRNN
jgi:uncharacterized membrane protein YqjE